LGDALIPAAAALLGALLGSLVSVALTRRGWTREDFLRFIDHKRSAYATVTGHSFELARTVDPAHREALTAELWRSVAVVRLLSPPEIGELARELAFHSYELAMAGGDQERERLSASLVEARKAFEQAARDDLQQTP
jgi:hypothetical protein